MNKPLHHFFTNDHRRIESILEKAMENPDEIEMNLYHDFRVGLLTHIKMEEKILFPAAQKANGGTPMPIMAKLRLEHGALTALMVPPPTEDLVTVLKYVLDKHDLIEEEPGGMYDICESLTQSQTQELLDQLSKIAQVPVLPHNEAAFALDVAKRTLARAGYDYNAIAGLE